MSLGLSLDFRFGRLAHRKGVQSGDLNINLESRIMVVSSNVKGGMRRLGKITRPVWLERKVIECDLSDFWEN